MTQAGVFAGEWALVTGAASGIGRGAARRLATDGAALLINGIDHAAVGALADELRAEGATVRCVPGDLGGLEGADALLRSLSDAEVDLFVHGASPERRNEATVARVTQAEWNAMLDVNVRAGFFVGRELGLRMAATGRRGRMVFVASLHAETPRNLPHYSAAKAGQVMVVRELARFFGPAGIRVNAVAPGAVPGGGFAGDFGALAARVPLRRVGAPEDVAAVIATLLSDAASPYVTGAVVPVDGGLSLTNWIEPAAVPSAIA